MRREADREVTREARWGDATGENLIEKITAVCDYLVALATYRAAVKRWPKDTITLRNRARVLERSWRDRKNPLAGRAQPALPGDYLAGSPHKLVRYCNKAPSSGFACRSGRSWAKLITPSAS